MVFGRKKKAKKKVKKKTMKKTKKKGKAFGGYKIVPDANFAKIIGKKALAPSAMTKNVWKYIKKHNLGKK